MTSVRFNKLLAVLLAAMLMLTLLSTFAFAADLGAEADGAATAAEGADEAPEDDAEPAEEEDEAEDKDETPAATDKATDDKKDEKKPLNWDLIISLSIIGLAAVTFVILYFAWPKFKDAVNKFFRDYKSEMGKIVWSSWADVKKNTAVVIIIVAFFAITIGVLDFVFGQGIAALGKLFA